MAKSRRKAGGCTRGRLKPKKLGKGWLAMRKQRGSVKPVVRNKPEEGAADAQSSDS